MRNGKRNERDPYVIFSVRLPLSMRRRAEALAKKRVWSRNRAIEQALGEGLTRVELTETAEAARR